MKRHRTIAASPERSASRAWSTICDLVADTLERSASIDRSAVEATMAHAGEAGLMLVAGGHLEAEPITVLAGELDLEITTVSGDKALTVEENLNPVPGAASAEEWMIHLPAPAPLERVVHDICATDPHVSWEPPGSAVTASATRESALVDSAALAAWAKEGR